MFSVFAALCIAGFQVTPPYPTFRSFLLLLLIFLKKKICLIFLFFSFFFAFSSYFMNWKKCMTCYMKINGIMSERCIIMLSTWLSIGDWSLQNSHFCPQIILFSCFIEDINFPFILVFQVLGPLESLAFAYVPSFQVCTPVIIEVGPLLFPFHASGTKWLWQKKV